MYMCIWNEKKRIGWIEQSEFHTYAPLTSDSSNCFLFNYKDINQSQMHSSGSYRRDSPYEAWIINDRHRKIAPIPLLLPITWCDWFKQCTSRNARKGSGSKSYIYIQGCPLTQLECTSQFTVWLHPGPLSHLSTDSLSCPYQLYTLLREISHLLKVISLLVNVNQFNLIFLLSDLHMNQVSIMFSSSRLPLNTSFSLCARRCQPSRTWQRSWRHLVPWSLSLVTCCAPSPPCLTSEPHPLHFQKHCCAKARSATRAGRIFNFHTTDHIFTFLK